MTDLVDRLNPAAIWVWYLLDGDIAPTASEHRAQKFISAEETNRCARLRAEGDQNRFLAARVVIRTMLSAYTGERPEHWTFCSGEYGRPEIERPAAWSRVGISITHTDGLVACAVAPGLEVGVDAEAVDHRIDCMKLARRFFSRHEVEALHGLPAAERASAFLDYWTLKEAYVKALGCGMAIRLDGFGFDLHQSSPTICFSPAIADDPSHWRFSLNHPSPRHSMALAVKCVRRCDIPIEITHLTADSLPTASSCNSF